MEKFRCFCSSTASSLSWFCRKSMDLFSSSYKAALFRLNSFCLQLSYFLFVSLLGFFFLQIFDRRSVPKVNKSGTANLDLFFMSVSATTGSSLVSVPMEEFSVPQHVVFIFLMFLGGDVFASMISLHLKRYKLVREVESGEASRFKGDLEMAIRFDCRSSSNSNENISSSSSKNSSAAGTEDVSLEDKRVKCSRYLVNLMSGYLITVQLCGAALILSYLCIGGSTRKKLQRKRIGPVLFSIFTSVSSFSNCGLIPNNENMMAFKDDSLLLLMLMPLVTMGGTMFPPCLNLLVWTPERTFPREELRFLKEKTWEVVGFDHLLPMKTSLFLAASAVGFTALQFVLFCCLQWHSEAAGGLDRFQKLVAGLFQSIASRYSGESVFDLSLLSPALLVVYIVMMYIPSYTFVSPNKKAAPRFESEEVERKEKGKGGETLELWLPPQAFYPVVFVVLVCMTEQTRMYSDPLNFNVLNIAFEVVSAYGNVGLSVGYSCERLLGVASNGDCSNTSLSFSGKWSKKGKVVIIIVMFFGKLKKFTASGGKAWHTL
ncbi:unnamed protein product [Victoria cruziana]